MKSISTTYNETSSELLSDGQLNFFHNWECEIWTCPALPKPHPPAGRSDRSSAISAQQQWQHQLKEWRTTLRCFRKKLEKIRYLKCATSSSTLTIIRHTDDCPWIRCIPVEVNNLVPESYTWKLLFIWENLVWM